MLELVLVAACLGGFIDPEVILRGDSNADGELTISDASYTAAWLWQSGPEPECLEAADFNGDGNVDGADVSGTTNFLFDEGSPPAAPYPDACGEDPLAPYLGCVAGCP